MNINKKLAKDKRNEKILKDFLAWQGSKQAFLRHSGINKRLLNELLVKNGHVLLVQRRYPDQEKKEILKNFLSWKGLKKDFLNHYGVSAYVLSKILEREKSKVLLPIENCRHKKMDAILRGRL